MQLMKILKIIFLLILITTNLFANTNYFNQGMILFEKKEFDKAKFKFEQDLVFNPKNEKSYLYLSKNEEATFNLAKLKLEKSDFAESKKLIDQLLVFCKNYCQKSKELKTKIENSLKK